MSDKRGGAPQPSWLIDGFRSAVVNAHLTDLHLHSSDFTWKQGKGSQNWIEECLYLALVNSEWLSKFHNARSHTVSYSSSDHMPIVLMPQPLYQKSRSSRFHFENSWLREADCRSVVQRSWATSKGQNIVTQLYSCGVHLGVWNLAKKWKRPKMVSLWKDLVRVLSHSRYVTNVAAFDEAQPNLQNALLQ